MVTSSLQAVTTELRRRMGPIPSSGAEVCRAKRINGQLRPDLGWSQHAYGNAEDLAINGVAAQQPYVNELARMRSQGYPVGLVLHAAIRSDHTDHIHLEGAPSLSGTPACAGGTATDTAISGGGIRDTDSSGVAQRDDAAPNLNILGVDFGPIVYRGMWLIVTIVAVWLAVKFLTGGLDVSAMGSRVTGVMDKALSPWKPGK